jgi:hypothetical protein
MPADCLHPEPACDGRLLDLPSLPHAFCLHPIRIVCFLRNHQVAEAADAPGGKPMLSAIQTAMDGIARNVQGIQSCAENIANISSGDVPIVETELASSVIQMQVYKLAAKANAQVAAAMNDMLGELVDTIA